MTRREDNLAMEAYSFRHSLPLEYIVEKAICPLSVHYGMRLDLFFVEDWYTSSLPCYDMEELSKSCWSYILHDEVYFDEGLVVRHRF